MALWTCASNPLLSDFHTGKRSHKRWLSSGRQCHNSRAGFGLVSLLVLYRDSIAQESDKLGASRTLAARASSASSAMAALCCSQVACSASSDSAWLLRAAVSCTSLHGCQVSCLKPQMLPSVKSLDCPVLLAGCLFSHQRLCLIVARFSQLPAWYQGPLAPSQSRSQMVPCRMLRQSTPVLRSRAALNWHAALPHRGNCAALTAHLLTRGRFSTSFLLRRSPSN